jgi:hypothetical protein
MKRLIALAAAAIGLLSLTGTANALILSPSNTIAGIGYGPDNCEPNCVTTVFGLPAGSLSLLYKDNVDGGEEGSYTGSYSTFFYNTSSDPSNALLWYTGGPAIDCGGCYLAIKDGNSTPGYYFYDLSAWNGTESIWLDNFWPNRGAISHVSIWGGTGTTSVPEPATVALLGIGLLGAGFAKRRRKA